MALSRSPMESCPLGVRLKAIQCVCMFVCLVEKDTLSGLSVCVLCRFEEEVKVDRILSLVNEAELRPEPRILRSHATSS
jgi:hypothetical protein